MKNAVLVAESGTLEELPHEGTDYCWFQYAAVAVCVHVFLEIQVHVFKYEDELVFRVYHIVQPDNVVVLIRKREMSAS